jgi:hypothetical protein
MKEMSKSYREPQLVPADHCYTILQDHGPHDGGWGPVAVTIPGFSEPRPFVYTGSDQTTLNGFISIAKGLAAETGKPTRFVKFTTREDVLVIGGSS